MGVARMERGRRRRAAAVAENFMLLEAGFGN
jgi:hypothetical protein